MVISYDSVNRVLDVLINDYKTDKNYPKMQPWKDILPASNQNIHPADVMVIFKESI